MVPSTTHPFRPTTSFDGGDLDCGNGLLLLIRQHIDPLHNGQFLEIISYEPSVEADLPSWCRLTGNDLVNIHRDKQKWSFLVSKGTFEEPPTEEAPAPEITKPKNKRRKPQMPVTQEIVAPFIPVSLPDPAPAPEIAPLSVLPVGSWPRPRWLLRSLHQRLQGQISEAEFTDTADDAVRLAVAAQERAGVDVVTDGEQRRDNYSSFVGRILQNTQLIPITDLMPYVDDPAEFGRELQALDVPADEVRHPAVFGPLGRNEALVADETRFVQEISEKPVKVSLPGPYLLARTMWMECVSDRAYDNREHLAGDVVRILREEVHHLLADGVALVQFDEPVLTEVLYGEGGAGGRTFMCGALGERQDTEEELDFAQGLLQDVTAGFPTERLAVHVCRGNWTTDETKALSGDYRPLIPMLSSLNVGTLMLELATPRAGELSALAGLREDQRIGVGVLNQKNAGTDTLDDVVARAEHAIEMLGRDRVLLNTDCGFATFADNPIVTAEVAERQLALLTQARDLLRSR